MATAAGSKINKVSPFDLLIVWAMLPCVDTYRWHLDTDDA